MTQALFNIRGAERQTLDWILDWRSSMVEALIRHRASVQLAVQAGTPVPLEQAAGGRGLSTPTTCTTVPKHC